MIMGGVNMKLMQGIGEVENQMQKEKQTPKSEEPVKKEEKNKDIQKAAGKPRTTKEQPKVKKNTTMRKKDDNKPDKMQKKQVFSFRAILSDIVIWKAYAVASGKTMEDICNVAMNEYLKRHKLSGVEQMIFDAIKARDSNDGE